MPESSAWQDIVRWDLRNHDGDGVGDGVGLELEDGEEVVIHNELYVSESEDVENDAGRPPMEVEIDYESSDERQSHLSGISQQDRDNKTILLRQAASGKFFAWSLDWRR